MWRYTNIEKVAKKFDCPNANHHVPETLYRTLSPLCDTWRSLHTTPQLRCVAALHRPAQKLRCYCILLCRVKVKFILTRNAVMLRWLAAEGNRYSGTEAQLRRSMNGPYDNVRVVNIYLLYVSKNSKDSNKLVDWFKRSGFRKCLSLDRRNFSKYIHIRFTK